MNKVSHQSKNYSTYGLSLVEFLVVVVILGIASSMVYSGFLREKNRTLAYSAANNIAGWLEATRRSSERGAACLIRLYPSSNVNSSYTLATGEVNPASSSSIPNQCQSNNSLKINSVNENVTFNVSSTPVNTFIFTPRGTMFNPGNANGDFSGAVKIGLNVMRSGSAQLPTYCITILPPVGEIDIYLSSTTTC